MQHTVSLHNLLEKSCPNIHKNRLPGTVNMVDAAINSNSISVTNLGRYSSSKATEKACIKTAEYRLGNAGLLRDRSDIFKLFSRQLLGGNKQPLLLVDWTPLTNETFYALVASTPKKGRSLPVYFEIHPHHKKECPEVRRNFLRNLKSTLPDDVSPIIVTDAGFKGPWFDEVLSMNWGFIGRVRNNSQIFLEKENDWTSIKSLYLKASEKPLNLGAGILNKTSKHQIPGYFHTLKEKPKGRTNYVKNKIQSSKKSNKKYSSMNETPWLLVTSLNPDEYDSKKIVAIYKKRMQIEESFRDMKSHRFGLSLGMARANSAVVWTNLLVIASLAVFMLYIIGDIAERQNFQFKFQANTIKRYRVLSLVFLGRRVLLYCKKKQSDKLTESIFGKIDAYLTETKSGQKM